MAISCRVPLWDGMELCCEIVPMGRDVTIAVYGGETAHVGSVVLAVPRDSLTGTGRSATSSVLNCPGHKDEAIARRFAESFAVQNDGTAVCSCGIHIDHLTPDGIRRVREASEELLERALAAWSLL